MRCRCQKVERCRSDKFKICCIFSAKGSIYIIWVCVCAYLPWNNQKLNIYKHSSNVCSYVFREIRSAIFFRNTKYKRKSFEVPLITSYRLYTVFITLAYFYIGRKQWKLLNKHKILQYYFSIYSTVIFEII